MELNSLAAAEQCSGPLSHFCMRPPVCAEARAGAGHALRRVSELNNTLQDHFGDVEVKVLRQDPARTADSNLITILHCVKKPSGT